MEVNNGEKQVIDCLSLSHRYAGSQSSGRCLRRTSASTSTDTSASTGTSAKTSASTGTSAKTSASTGTGTKTSFQNA